MDLVNVLVPRTLCLRLYDLSGRIVYEHRRESRTGHQALVWDGRDAIPGLYLLELNIEGDAETIRQGCSLSLLLLPRMNSTLTIVPIKPKRVNSFDVLFQVFRQPSDIPGPSLRSSLECLNGFIDGTCRDSGWR